MTAERVRVALQSADPLPLAGLVRYLECRPSGLADSDRRAEADVAIVADELSLEVVGAMRRAANEIGTPVVLITTKLDEADMLIALECKVVGVLLRSIATGERVLYAVLAAATGDAIMPPSLVGGLLRHIGHLQQEVLALQGSSAAGLTPPKSMYCECWPTVSTPPTSRKGYATRSVRLRALSMASPIG